MESADTDAPWISLPRLPANELTAPEGAMHFVSGTSCKVLRPGRPGEKPGPHDVAKVRIAAWAADGEIAAASAEATIRLDAVPPALSETVQLMTPGERRRSWAPAAQPGPRVYEVELVSFVRTRPPPTIDPNLRSP